MFWPYVFVHRHILHGHVHVHTISQTSYMKDVGYQNKWIIDVCYMQDQLITSYCVQTVLWQSQAFRVKWWDKRRSECLLFPVRVKLIMYTVCIISPGPLLLLGSLTKIIPFNPQPYKYMKYINAGGLEHAKLQKCHDAKESKECLHMADLF